jgi:hypothetical protein
MAQRKRQPKAAEGTPRWVAIVGAIVGVGGLAWAVVSHFLPTSEGKKAETAGLSQQATATGSGVAINGAGQARIVVGGEMATDKASTPGKGSQGGIPSRQSATASEGGAAVNAADSAVVQVQNH